MTTKTCTDALTIAMIAAGVTTALIEGCPVTDYFDGEDDLILDVIRHARLVEDEWERRYGKPSGNPEGAPFNFYLTVAKPFGTEFARRLAVDHEADPEPLIAELFDAAEARKAEYAALRAAA